MPKIPPAVIGVPATCLAERYTHANLDSLFYTANFPGDPKEGANKVDKCMDWMRRANMLSVDALALFGNLIGEFMEEDAPPSNSWSTPAKPDKDPRDALNKVLENAGLSYSTGGKIIGSSVSAPTLALGQRLAQGGLETLEIEFKRAYDTVVTDPPAAVTAACAILESLCKTYLDAEGQGQPSKASIGPLWKATTKHLGLSPEALEDDDLKRILSGCFSIVDGIGALRTHAGSAHGRSGRQQKTYKVQPRHARLAVHSAHTLAGFVLETWDSRKSN